LLRYYPPVVTTPFDGVKAREWWVKEIQRGLGGVPWLKNPEGNPRRMQAGLREAAFPLDGLARTALLLPEHRDELTMHVRAGADIRAGSFLFRSVPDSTRVKRSATLSRA
jgi:hypothetical protein